MERTIGDLQAYFRRTNIKDESYSKYCLCLSEIYVLLDHLKFDRVDAICMAFDYGMAKGYRAAKAAKK